MILRNYSHLVAQDLESKGLNSGFVSQITASFVVRKSVYSEWLKQKQINRKINMYKIAFLIFLPQTCSFYNIPHVGIWQLNSSFVGPETLVSFCPTVIPSVNSLQLHLQNISRIHSYELLPDINHHFSSGLYQPLLPLFPYCLSWTHYLYSFKTSQLSLYSFLLWCPCFLQNIIQNPY